MSISHSIKSRCNVCVNNCGVVITLDDHQHIVKIVPNKEDPITNGYICERANLLKTGNRNRVTSPLKKINNAFVPISWEQAIDEIAYKLEKLQSGGDGDKIFLMQSEHPDRFAQSILPLRLLESAGLRHYTSLMGIEQYPKSTVYLRLLNNWNVQVQSKNVDVFLLIGKNIWDSHNHPPHNRTDFFTYKENSTTVINVDPVYTKNSAKSDYFLKIKPGTDAWLIAAIIQIIFKNNWENKQFINSNIQNVKSLIDYVNTYNLDECSNITGIDIRAIESMAKIIATAKQFAFMSDIGLDHTANGYIASGLLISLSLIVNSISSGAMKICPALIRHCTPITHQKIAPLTGHSIDKFIPATILAKNIYKSDTEKFKMIVVEETNPLSSLPNSQELEHAFSKIDCVVVMDQALTKTANSADYILPTLNFQETHLISGMHYYPDQVICYTPPALIGPADAKSHIQISNLLIEKLKLVDSNILNRATHLFTTDIDEYYIYIDALFNEGFMFTQYLACKTIGTTYPDNDLGIYWELFFIFYKRVKNLNPVDAGKTATESMNRLISTGSLRYSEYLPVPEKIDLSKISDFYQMPDLATLTDPDYKFILSTGRRTTKNVNSRYGDNDYFFVELCSEDAQKLGLQDGDAVELSTENGSIVTNCIIDDNLQPGYIRSPNSRYANLLTSTNIPVNAPFLSYVNPPFKYVFANVKKV